MSLHRGDTASGWPNYIWQDDQNPIINIARIDNKNQYILNGNNLYVINRHPLEDFDQSKKQYKLLFKTNGSYQQFYYPSKDEIPTFLVFDTNTANVRPYLKIEDVPLEEQNYFTTLQLQ